MSRFLELEAKAMDDDYDYEEDEDEYEYAQPEVSPRLAARVARAAEQKQEEDDDALVAVPDGDLDVLTTSSEEKKKFRLNTTRILLTYAQVPASWSKENLARFIREKLVSSGVKALCIGKERHKDGGIHYHAAVEVTKKMDITNARHFDFQTFHPNVRSVRRGQKNWLGTVEYCQKDGDYLEDNVNLFPTSQNFVRRKLDHDAWVENNKQKKTVDVKWPVILPDGTPVHKPTMELQKKRHFWIWGQSDVGKTYWAQNTFEGQKVYVAGTEKFAFDRYADEEVIIFDDVDLTRDHKTLICNISNYNRIPVPLPPTRYVQKMWRCHQYRTIFVLSNAPPPVGLEGEGWFDNRFTTINLTVDNSLYWQGLRLAERLGDDAGAPRAEPIMVASSSSASDRSPSYGSWGRRKGLRHGSQRMENPPRDFVPASRVIGSGGKSSVVTDEPPADPEDH
jgi:Geminivirus Rep catalytic domain/RNA helicase